MTTKGAGMALTNLIGNTPLIRFSNITEELVDVELCGKAEWFNPSGSVKDRAVLRIIEDGERKGLLTKGKILLDATSGNAGIAYAMIGAAKGYPVRLTVPANASVERMKIMKAFGAKLVMTSPLEGSDGAIRKARELYNGNPDAYFYGDQYSSESNWRAHYETTGVEILEQTRKRVTHFVAGIGTSGTLMGAGRRLKEADHEIRVIAVEPDSPMHGLEGLKHMESSLVPAIYDPNFPDDKIQIGTEEAQIMTKRLAREEGLFVGTSAGAAVAAALKLAKRIEKGLMVTILPDGGNKYLNDRYWEEG